MAAPIYDVAGEMDVEDLIVIAATGILAGLIIFAMRRCCFPAPSPPRPTGTAALDKEDAVVGSSRGNRPAKLTVAKDGLVRRYRRSRSGVEVEEADVYCRAIGLASLLSGAAAAGGELMPLLIVSVRAANVAASARAIHLLHSVADLFVVVHITPGGDDATILAARLESARDVLTAAPTEGPPRRRVLGSTTTAGRVAIVRQIGGCGASAGRTRILDFEPEVRNELGRFGFSDVVVRDLP